ncbi:transcriptional regulator with XRE-family HTH domain [Catenuloplanes nepalensis]|uniref:Transcriptional regulator with XRE-family HTH domain n=2 Tax=Catenuloplanes nepalensis TaxID=587533 RepID=A0ABT9MNS2_9ACTN|nr:transcriptional regulator with XRE-family HTH domain [Catenuloplanes nepalensis]
MFDRVGMARFLRSRREALQPSDVGIFAGERRRTPGLRREEVAALSSMSADYYSRLERAGGPQPSEQMVASIAQGLHLSLDERDHLFSLAGYRPPASGRASDHVSPGMMRALDRLTDTPAEVSTELGETLRQTPLGAALTGDNTRFTGPARSIIYRWFTDERQRDLYPPDLHELHSRAFVSGLRVAVGRDGADSRAAHISSLLLEKSREFADYWDRYEIGVKMSEFKRLNHPEVGLLELNCQTLLDPERSHRLLIYTAVPGSESWEKLRLLSVIGVQQRG